MHTSDIFSACHHVTGDEYPSSYHSLGERECSYILLTSTPSALFLPYALAISTPVLNHRNMLHSLSNILS